MEYPGQAGAAFLLPGLVNGYGKIRDELAAEESADLIVMGAYLILVVVTTLGLSPFVATLVAVLLITYVPFFSLGLLELFK